MNWWWYSCVWDINSWLWWFCILFLWSLGWRNWNRLIPFIRLIQIEFEFFLHSLSIGFLNIAGVHIRIDYWRSLMRCRKWALHHDDYFLKGWPTYVSPKPRWRWLRTAELSHRDSDISHRCQIIQQRQCTMRNREWQHQITIVWQSSWSALCPYDRYLAARI